MATLTLIVRKGRSNVFYKTARIPEGNKVAKFYTKKTGSWVSKNDIVYVASDRYIFNIDDAEIDQVGDADYYVTLSVDGGPEETVVQGYIDYEAPVRSNEEPELAPVAGILLLDSGASVPSDTPLNTVIFEKPLEVVYDFRAGSLPAGWSKIGSTPNGTFSGAGLAVTLAAGQGYIGPTLPNISSLVLEVLFSTYGDKVVTGPGFVDEAGNGVNTGLYNNPNGQLLLNTSAYLYSNGYLNNGGLTPQNNMAYRLIKKGGSYTTQASLDGGVSWGAESAVLTNVTSVTRPAVFDSLGTAAFTIAQAVLKTTSAGPKGYWDGTQIKSL